MDFLWIVILACLWLVFHCTDGYAHGRHEIVKRDVNQTLFDFGIPVDIVKSILTPIANLADKFDLNLPIISSYSSKN